MTHLFKRFARDDSGAALVEFGLLLPSALLFLALSVEGARTFWSYQSTITGVRDAARFVSRAAPRDICASGGSLSDWDDRLTRIVRDTQSGQSLFPAAVTIGSVTATLDCSGTGYRAGKAPVATVTATLRIDYPFNDLFALSGSDLGAVTTAVSDQARVLGG